ncbi:transcription factor bHLH121-like protein isoform X2 [Gossypium australe]|uniref:Transcription factor bHLH121-like protein isoform X2 n=1 Tax=Gossypium australe TaxID=47621 RepID=A0A5B6WK56_9ROSI|nr:transcription factor bHLH121-like protein isoform X2 [Gossypium australe]
MKTPKKLLFDSIVYFGLGFVQHLSGGNDILYSSTLFLVLFPNMDMGVNETLVLNYILHLFYRKSSKSTMDALY